MTRTANDGRPPIKRESSKFGGGPPVVLTNVKASANLIELAPDLSGQSLSKHDSSYLQTQNAQEQTSKLQEDLPFQKDPYSVINAAAPPH